MHVLEYRQGEGSGKDPLRRPLLNAAGAGSLERQLWGSTTAKDIAAAAKFAKSKAEALEAWRGHVGVLPGITLACRAKVTAALEAAETEADIAAAVKILTRAEWQAVDGEIGRLEGTKKSAQSRLAELRATRVAVDEMIAWAALDNPVLRSVGESLFHKVHDGPLFNMVSDDPPPREIADSKDNCGVFLVQHNWAALLDGAEVDDGGVRLPFDHNCFEFNASGRRVCFLVSCENGEPYHWAWIVQTSVGWAVGSPGDGDDLTDFFREQVRAIAITLDAEIVVSEIVRAPYRLNARRIERSQTPVYDHHILKLAHRRRPPSLERDPEAPIVRRRLHYRRGHWRHYQNHKTWIKWMLVGDPALGFADKDYRL